MNLPQVQGRQGLVFGPHERGPKSIPNLRQNPVENLVFRLGIPIPWRDSNLRIYENMMSTRRGTFVT